MSNDGGESSFSQQLSEGRSHLSDDRNVVSPEIVPSSPDNRPGCEHPYRLKRRHTSWKLYWVSITPLICGGLGPMLTLLALSGCVDPWRFENLLNGTTRTDKDPKWVIAIIGVALFVGLIANIFLLLTMLGRANQKYMQLLSIALWTLECMYVHLRCLLKFSLAVMEFTAIGVYVRIVGDGGRWIYAQGFWMTVCSASISFVCAFLLALNAFILPPSRKRGKVGLSCSQRVFVIQIMVFILWLAMYHNSFTTLKFRGAAIFCGVEKFTFSESLYFVNTTVTTVGFGNGYACIWYLFTIVVPTTNLGRALVMPYAILGILFLGLLVSSLRTIVAERHRARRKKLETLLNRHQKRINDLKSKVRR